MLLGTYQILFICSNRENAEMPNTILIVTCSRCFYIVYFILLLFFVWFLHYVKLSLSQEKNIYKTPIMTVEETEISLSTIFALCNDLINDLQVCERRLWIYRIYSFSTWLDYEVIITTYFSVWALDSFYIINFAMTQLDNVDLLYVNKITQLSCNCNGLESYSSNLLLPSLMGWKVSNIFLP